MRLWLVAIAAVIVVAAACDQVPLTSPTGSTIALTIDKTILPVNGLASVTAIVTESSGTPVHNGTVVTFNPSLGRTDPAEAPTVNGRATVTYIAPSVSGTATINAYSGGATTAASGNNSAGGVTIRVGAAAVGSVSVSASPSGIPTTGGIVTVTARVLDAASNPLPSTSVAFTADAGNLSSSSSLTDANGIATTTVTTNRATKVTATVGDKFGDFTIGALANPSVTIAVSGSATPTVNVPVPFTVTPGAATNASPTQAIIVDFGDGSPTVSYSNPSGPFGVTHTFTRAQGYTVTATAVDGNGLRGSSSTAVVVTHAALPTITLSATPNPTGVDGFTTFTVTAAPATGGPPLRSVVVRLSNGTVIYQGTSGGSFTYQFPGAAQVQTVIATATDANGEQATTQTVVVVP